MHCLGLLGSRCIRHTKIWGSGREQNGGGVMTKLGKNRGGYWEKFERVIIAVCLISSEGQGGNVG